ncbi:hypothetical protein ACFU5O_07370 [Streptomyces sp. NPDC057445]|uniref:hypothetical protein n=1 Tax=Streptomyces sp. NPDC057445 TaxID=3346136 RepID=UPI0036B1C98C
MTQDKSEEPERTGGPIRLWTGSERPFDPEDLVMASGRDVTPGRIERARKEIAEKGAAALERYLP